MCPSLSFVWLPALRYLYFRFDIKLWNSVIAVTSIHSIQTLWRLYHISSVSTLRDESIYFSSFLSVKKCNSKYVPFLNGFAFLYK